MRLVFRATDFGAAVRRHRGHLTLRAAAAASGASLATLSRIENGELPDVPMLLKLCTWLDRSPADFITQEPTYELEPGRSYCNPPTPPFIKRAPRYGYAA